MTKYKSCIGKTIHLTAERKRHIIARHPDTITHFRKMKQLLLKPDQIRVDKTDPQVLLFYRWFDKIGTGKYLVVVVKTNARNFALTFYLTSRIRTGKTYGKK